ncbi:hypothetical protein HMPREF1979_01322 [Actinomyces johnsonii F0542]|uniref:Uncharacterized protein n=1 Tax=Actinomyces johnsonii F0542 TaxID=1321818 RepID=U1QRX6_9ACTO|nr:hypothetical protein HMPREF1979_01322 [Actinomyces johnsonii F0542]
MSHAHRRTRTGHISNDSRIRNWRISNTLEVSIFTFCVNVRHGAGFQKI